MFVIPKILKEEEARDWYQNMYSNPRDQWEMSSFIYFLQRILSEINNYQKKIQLYLRFLQKILLINHLILLQRLYKRKIAQKNRMNKLKPLRLNHFSTIKGDSNKCFRRFIFQKRKQNLLLENSYSNKIIVILNNGTLLLF